MNKCEPPQLAPALSGYIMDLAAQNDYVPLEIMTDCAKRSYFTHLVCSLWGYHAVCVCGEKGHAIQRGLRAPLSSLGARGRNAKRMPGLTHDKLGDR